MGKTDKCLFCRDVSSSATSLTSSKDENDFSDTGQIHDFNQGQAFETLFKLLMMTGDTAIEKEDVLTYNDMISDQSFSFCSSCLKIMSTLVTLQNVLDSTRSSIEKNLKLIQMAIASSTETETLMESEVLHKEKALRQKILGSKLYETKKFQSKHISVKNARNVGIQTENDIGIPEKGVEIKVEDLSEYHQVDDHFEDDGNVEFAIFDELSNPCQDIPESNSDTENEEKSVHYEDDFDGLVPETLELRSKSKMEKERHDRKPRSSKSKTKDLKIKKEETNFEQETFVKPIIVDRNIENNEPTRRPMRKKRKSVKLKDDAISKDIQELGETVYTSKRSKAVSTLENQLLIKWGLDKLPRPKLIVNDCNGSSGSKDKSQLNKRKIKHDRKLRSKREKGCDAQDVIIKPKSQESLKRLSTLDVKIWDIKGDASRTRKWNRSINIKNEMDVESGEECDDATGDSDFELTAEDVPNSFEDTDRSRSQSDSEFEERDEGSPKYTKTRPGEDAATASRRKRKHKRKRTENGFWQRRRVIIRKGKLFFRNREFPEKNESLHCCFETCDFYIRKVETLYECSRKMLEHIKTVHIDIVDSKYQCKKCDLTFEKLKEYQQHVTESHNNLFRGDGCIIPTATADSKQECDICQKPLSQLALVKHKWTHKSEQEKDEWIASGFQDPTEHERTKKNKMKITPRFQCETCGKQFSHKSHFKAHEIVHIEYSKRPKIICETCGDTFTTTRGFNLHDWKMHKPEMLLAKWKYCKICDKKFLIKTHYDTHMMRSHGAEKIHACDKCERKFADTTGLKNHLNSHLPEDYRPFKCEYCVDCDISYRYRKNLLRHIRKMHKEKGFEIAPQNRKYINPVLSKPVMTCKQMYPCKICENKYFPMPSRLKKHMFTSHPTASDKLKKLKLKSVKFNTDHGNHSILEDDSDHHTGIITGDLDSVESQDTVVTMSKVEEQDSLENELSFLVPEGDKKIVYQF